MKETTKIITKYAYVKGHISKEKLISVFAGNKITITPQNIAWLNSETGKNKVIKEYQELLSMNDSIKKSSQINEKYDSYVEAKKIFNIE